MTREEKVTKRKLRAKRRADKRNAKYRTFLNSNSDKIRYGGFSIGKNGHASWEDSSSPTGYTQICSWQGTCQSPCNGDC